MAVRRGSPVLTSSHGTGERTPARRNSPAPCAIGASCGATTWPSTLDGTQLPKRPLPGSQGCRTIKRQRQSGERQARLPLLLQFPALLHYHQLQTRSPSWRQAHLSTDLPVSTKKVTIWRQSCYNNFTKYSKLILHWNNCLFSFLLSLLHRNSCLLSYKSHFTKCIVHLPKSFSKLFVSVNVYICISIYECIVYSKLHLFTEYEINLYVKEKKTWVDDIPLWFLPTLSLCLLFNKHL